MLGNGIKYETEVCRIGKWSTLTFLYSSSLLYLDPKGKNETKNGGAGNLKENLHLNVPKAGLFW